jgi:hypothetical protein
MGRSVPKSIHNDYVHTADRVDDTYHMKGNDTFAHRESWSVNTLSCVPFMAGGRYCTGWQSVLLRYRFGVQIILFP